MTWLLTLGVTNVVLGLLFAGDLFFFPRWLKTSKHLEWVLFLWSVVFVGTLVFSFTGDVALSVFSGSILPVVSRAATRLHVGDSNMITYLMTRVGPRFVKRSLFAAATALVVYCITGWGFGIPRGILTALAVYLIMVFNALDHLTSSLLTAMIGLLSIMMDLGQLPLSSLLILFSLVLGGVLLRRFIPVSYRNHSDLGIVVAYLAAAALLKRTPWTLAMEPVLAGAEVVLTLVLWNLLLALAKVIDNLKLPQFANAFAVPGVPFAVSIGMSTILGSNGFLDFLAPAVKICGFFFCALLGLRCADLFTRLLMQHLIKVDYLGVSTVLYDLLGKRLYRRSKWLLLGPGARKVMGDKMESPFYVGLLFIASMGLVVLGKRQPELLAQDHMSVLLVARALSVTGFFGAFLSLNAIAVLVTLAGSNDHPRGADEIMVWVSLALAFPVWFAKEEIVGSITPLIHSPLQTVGLIAGAIGTVCGIVTDLRSEYAAHFGNTVRLLTWLGLSLVFLTGLTASRPLVTTILGLGVVLIGYFLKGISRAAGQSHPKSLWTDSPLVSVAWLGLTISVVLPTGVLLAHWALGLQYLGFHVTDTVVERVLPLKRSSRGETNPRPTSTSDSKDEFGEAPTQAMADTVPGPSSSDD